MGNLFYSPFLIRRTDFDRPLSIVLVLSLAKKVSYIITSSLHTSIQTSRHQQPSLFYCIANAEHKH
jgi:hypothetical protein